MFNILFKSKNNKQPSREKISISLEKKVVVETIEVVDSVKKPTIEELIEQIHNEFNGAGDILLKEANEILGNCNFKIDKYDMLKQFGFTKTREVVEIDQKVEEQRMSDEIVNAIKKYRFHYSNQKFITKAVVDQICNKYNLICGKVSSYTGFVPQKNLDEIGAFKLKDEHYQYIVHHIGTRGFVTRIKTYQEYLDEQKLMDNWKMTNSEAFFDKITDMNTSLIHKNEELLICAPIKDMELKANERIQGNFIIEIPDPVVLHPVPEGYIVLTAWGDEKSDPLVVNNDILN